MITVYKNGIGEKESIEYSSFKNNIWTKKIKQIKIIFIAHSSITNFQWPKICITAEHEFTK